MTAHDEPSAFAHSATTAGMAPAIGTFLEYGGDTSPATLHATAPPPLTVRVLRGPGFEPEFAAAWDNLFARSSSVSHHLSRPWQEAFIGSERCRGKPLAVTVWRGRQLSALLLLEVRRKLGLSLAAPVGTGLPGYIGVLAEPGDDPAIELIATTCLRDRLFDVLCLHDVASDDVATRRLIAALANHGSSAHHVHRTVAPWIALGCSFEQYLMANKSAKSRQTLRRKERQVHKAASVRVERLRGVQVTTATVDRIAKVRAASWMKRRGAPMLNEPFHQRLLLRLAAADMLRVWFLSIDGDDAACIVGIAAHQRLYYAYPAFKLAYEHMCVGQVLTQYSIADTCADGFAVYDFGHGDADYKRFWATDCRQVERVFVGRSVIGFGVTGGLALAWRAVRNQTLRRLLKVGLHGLRGVMKSPEQRNTHNRCCRVEKGDQ